MSNHTTFDEFTKLAKQGSFVPVSKEVTADFLTPVSAFLKIAEHSEYAFLFESVEGGERLARYSFLGKDPFMVLRGQHNRTVVEHSTITEERDKPFLEVLREMMAQYTLSLIHI